MFNKLNGENLKNIRDKIFNLDLTNQLPDEYCNMTNKFSMANQIEARAPFLDLSLEASLVRSGTLLRRKR